MLNLSDFVFPLNTKLIVFLIDMFQFECSISIVNQLRISVELKDTRLMFVVLHNECTVKQKNHTFHCCMLHSNHTLRQWISKFYMSRTPKLMNITHF